MQACDHAGVSSCERDPHGESIVVDSIFCCAIYQLIVCLLQGGEKESAYVTRSEFRMLLVVYLIRRKELNTQ